MILLKLLVVSLGGFHKVARQWARELSRVACYGDAPFHEGVARRRLSGLARLRGVQPWWIVDEMVDNRVRRGMSRRVAIEHRTKRKGGPMFEYQTLPDFRSEPLPGCTRPSGEHPLLHAMRHASQQGNPQLDSSHVAMHTPRNCVTWLSAHI